MTMSELYSLMLNTPEPPKPVGAMAQEKNPVPATMALNRREPVLWVNPRHPTLSFAPSQGKQPAVAPQTRRALEELAQACGISASDAWTEAAHLWINQRQRDVAELSTPAGRELSHAVSRIWCVIDEQLRELRGEADVA
jgi:hypothetical protein